MQLKHILVQNLHWFDNCYDLNTQADPFFTIVHERFCLQNTFFKWENVTWYSLFFSLGWWFLCYVNSRPNYTLSSWVSVLVIVFENAVFFKIYKYKLWILDVLPRSPKPIPPVCNVLTLAKLQNQSLHFAMY